MAAKKSQIKYPLHLATDAQGPMGIFDASGRAVVMFSDTHVPVKGYVWQPENHPSKEPNGDITYYPQRNRCVREILDFLNSGLTTHGLADVMGARSAKPVKAKKPKHTQPGEDETTCDCAGCAELRK